MLTDLKVKVGPQFYRYHEGALTSVPSLFKEYHAQRILVVHGTVSFEKAQPFCHSWQIQSINSSITLTQENVVILAPNKFHSK